MKEGLLEKLFWFSGWLYDFSKYAAILLTVGLVSHYFIYSLLIVRGKSMEPNFVDGDIMLVNKFAYQINNPKRGDVVAMYFPGEASKRFIKRIVGLPSESVRISNNKIFINNVILTENYLPVGTVTFPELEKKLTNDEYFVVGDNRSGSSDSRAWGPVPERYIIGKATKKIFHISSKTN